RRPPRERGTAPVRIGRAVPDTRRVGTIRARPGLPNGLPMPAQSPAAPTRRPQHGVITFAPRAKIVPIHMLSSTAHHRSPASVRSAGPVGGEVQRQAVRRDRAETVGVGLFTGRPRCVTVRNGRSGSRRVATQISELPEAPIPGPRHLKTVPGAKHSKYRESPSPEMLGDPSLAAELTAAPRCWGGANGALPDGRRATQMSPLP